MDWKSQKIELITIGLLVTIFISVILFAVEPFQVFSNARNHTRRMHMETIISALNGYIADNGFYPDCIPKEKEGATPAIRCKEELAGDITGSKFPTDPVSDYQYMFNRVNENRVVIFSTAPEARDIKIVQ